MAQNLASRRFRLWGFVYLVAIPAESDVKISEVDGPDGAESGN